MAEKQNDQVQPDTDQFQADQVELSRLNSELDAVCERWQSRQEDLDWLGETCERVGALHEKLEALLDRLEEEDVVGDEAAELARERDAVLERLGLGAVTGTSSG